MGQVSSLAPMPVSADDRPARASGAAGLPAAFVAFEAAARAALGAVGDADAWDAGTRRRVLGVLDTVVNAVAVARGKVVTAEQNAGTWALKGDRDLPAFLGRMTRQGRGSGFAQVSQAATLAAMPAVADAMVDGPVTVKHVQEITRATATSPALAAELATPHGQARLLELAGRFDGAVFGRKIRQLGAGLDPAARQREHDAQRSRRFLTLAHTATGTEIKGLLDTVAGYKVQKMIDAFNPRPAKDDHRPRDVRQADALVAIAERTLADTRTTPRATAPVQALVTFNEDTWAALRGARDLHDGAGDRRSGGGEGRGDGGGRREGDGGRSGSGSGRSDDDSGGVTDSDSGSGVGAAGDTMRNPAQRASGRGSMPDVVARLRGVPPVVDETGQAWPASEIARALCDCVLTRAVLGAESQLLDLGHDERLFNRAQWLAIYASGQTTCAVTGCEVPLRYTELHHLAWWDRDNGRTDQGNAGPECHFHHHDIHRNDIRVTRLPDGTYEHRWPDGRLYGGVPPGGQPGSETGGQLSGLTSRQSGAPPDGLTSGETGGPPGSQSGGLTSGQSDVPPVGRQGGPTSGRSSGLTSRKADAAPCDGSGQPDPGPSPTAGKQAALWTA